MIFRVARQQCTFVFRREKKESRWGLEQHDQLFPFSVNYHFKESVRHTDASTFLPVQTAAILFACEAVQGLSPVPERRPLYMHQTDQT